jgi:hypothetical protein
MKITNIISHKITLRNDNQSDILTISKHSDDIITLTIGTGLQTGSIMLSNTEFNTLLTLFNDVKEQKVYDVEINTL